MKLRDRISWMMGYVQRTLLPHLDECFDIPLTEHEQHLVSILEIIEVEKHIVRRSATQWLGRKLLTREAIARAYVAKAFCRYLSRDVKFYEVSGHQVLRFLFLWLAARLVPAQRS